MTLIEQMHTYSDPGRDPRHHTVSTVFIGNAKGKPIARDDARSAGIFSADNLPAPIVFDHKSILNDYFAYKNGALREQIFGYLSNK